MPDYTRLQKTADRLIKKSGREISIVRLALAEDTDETPWRGTTKPRQEPEDVVETSGVFVPISATSYLGIEIVFKNDNVARGQQVILVPALASEDDISEYDEVHDNGSIWKIVRAQLLKPGPVPLLYAFEVKQ